MHDRLSKTGYGSVRLRGLLGARVDACRVNRMVAHDEDYLLWPYEQGVPVVPTQSTDLRYFEEIAPLRAPRGELFWVYPRGMAPRPEDTVSDWQGETHRELGSCRLSNRPMTRQTICSSTSSTGSSLGGWPPKSRTGTWDIFRERSLEVVGYVDASAQHVGFVSLL